MEGVTTTTASAAHVDHSYGARIVRHQMKAMQNTVKQKAKQLKQHHKTLAPAGQGQQTSKRKQLSTSAKRARQRRRCEKEAQNEETTNSSGHTGPKHRKKSVDKMGNAPKHFLDQIREEELETQRRRKRNLSLIKDMDSMASKSRKRRASRNAGSEPTRDIGAEKIYCS